MNTPAGVASNYIDAGIHKTRLRFRKMLLLSILAGAFIALAGVGASTASCMVDNPSLAKLVGACVFPGGLAMVVLAGSELFTGNCLLIIPLLSKKVAAPLVLRNWVVVYCGNFIGSLLVAALSVYSHQAGQFSGALVVSMFSTAITKCSLTFGDAFLRGIACNFLVCIAVWISFAATDAIGKLAGLYFPILLFVVSGFEHSIANMFYIPVALFAKGVPAYAEAAAQSGLDLSALTWGHFLAGNLLPVTLGNLVGGLAVGIIYWYCYVKEKRELGSRAAHSSKGRG